MKDMLTQVRKKERKFVSTEGKEERKNTGKQEKEEGSKTESMAAGKERQT